MKKAIIALLVLIGLLVAVDFGVAAAAEQQVSQRMRTELGLATDPQVRINGFPFLTQAAQGDYQQVVVNADRLTVGQLTEVSVRADLRHVRIGLAELLGGGQRTVRIDEAEGTVRINADDLERQLPGVTDLRIEPVNPADPERRPPGVAESSAVRLLGKVSLLGQQLDVAATASMQLDGRTVLIVPSDFEVTGIGSTAELPPTAAAGAQRPVHGPAEHGEPAVHGHPDYPQGRGRRARGVRHRAGPGDQRQRRAPTGQ